jgi:hypothetical protein
MCEILGPCKTPCTPKKLSVRTLAERGQLRHAYTLDRGQAELRPPSGAYC